MKIKEAVEQGRTVLGLELGSTRIKAVLIDGSHQPIAMGSYEWENQLKEGIWTYDLEEAFKGIRQCYLELKQQVKDKYQVTLKRVSAMGISGMMHGYLPFDQKGNQLTEFRTWRNTMTLEAAQELSTLFSFQIPQRWSIAHLYQAMLNREDHVKDIAYLTTLAGYIHWKLTGQQVMGIGEASGMFPVDTKKKDYEERMIQSFEQLEKKKGYSWKLRDILPKVLVAGEDAGYLTKEGALFLDPEGDLEEGIPFCPPEGDAGTGMVATNAVEVGTGNVSAGTSIFAMVVLAGELSRVHEELDIVTTPAGDNVAMVHCNNGTSDLNAWVGLFEEFTKELGVSLTKDDLYELLYKKALEADEDCGGLLSYNFYSGEHIAKVQEGRPLFVRKPKAKFTLANFMRNHLYSSMASLKIGLDILLEEEKVSVDCIYGHGGLFKTKAVAQRFLSAAFGAPVAVMENATEGGPWGMALLASYMLNKKEDQSLSLFLNEQVFQHQPKLVLTATNEEKKGFEEYMRQYVLALPVERCAVENIKERE